jgi:hypothetical protein
VTQAHLIEGEFTSAPHTLNSGRWVTAKTYGDFYGFTEDVLGNWRYKDKKAKRTEAAPGFPIYKRFGRAVRYWDPTGAAAGAAEAKAAEKKAAAMSDADSARGTAA